MNVSAARIAAEHTIEVRVTELRRTRVRMWLCRKLLVLAALVAPVHLEVRT